MGTVAGGEQRSSVASGKEKNTVASGEEQPMVASGAERGMVAGGEERPTVGSKLRPVRRSIRSLRATRIDNPPPTPIPTPPRFSGPILGPGRVRANRTSA